MNSPLVSVNIATYNRAHLLSRCLDSVLSQDYQNLEIIIVNDCSSDETVEIVKEYEQVDSRIKLISHAENKGLAAARNTAYKSSKGKYIAFMDDDDEWVDENKIENQVNIFENHSNNLAIVCSSVRLVDQDYNHQEKVIRKPKHLKSHILTRNGIIYSPTVMARRAIVEKLGGFDINLVRGIDSDFYRRCIIQYDYDVFFMPEITTSIHEYGGDRITSINDSEEIKKALVNMIYVVNKFKKGFFLHPVAFLKRLKSILVLFLKYIYKNFRWRYDLVTRSIKEFLSRYKKFGNTKNASIVFMTGMPRTGSSLMKNYFGYYPGIKVMPFEARGFFVNWQKAFDSNKVLVDKSTHYIRSLSNLYATCKSQLNLCCIIRDPRDQLCSLFEFERHPELPRNQKFWSKWYQQYKNLFTFAENHKDVKLFLVRYEDLVTQPIEAKKAFLKWINILNDEIEVTKEYEIANDNDIQDDKVSNHQKVHGSSFGKWKDVSDPNKVEIISSYQNSEDIKKLMDLFGYYPEFSKNLDLSLSDNITFFHDQQ